MNISAINKGYNVALKSDYNSYQEVPMNSYPAYEEEPKSSSSMLGLVGLGLLAAGGIGYGIWKHRSVGNITKELAENKTALEKATNEIKDLKAAKEAAEKAKTKAEALKNEAEELRVKGFCDNIIFDSYTPTSLSKSPKEEK